MSTEGLINGSTCEDSCAFSNATDLLDFLNSSDTEAEDSKVVVGSLPDPHSEAESTAEDSPSLTLSITNVVVMASMQCHLRLKEIARSSVNVEYKALQNHVIMRLRSPYTVATIWSSGKIWCTGATSLVKAKVGARRIARRIAKCGFPCKFSKYRVVNIMATCHLPFRVRLDELVKEKPMLMSYEPELSPGLTFKTDPNSSTLLKLFSTGRIVLMGSSMDTIGALVEELIPLAALHQTDEPLSESEDEEDKIVKAAAREEVAIARRMLKQPSDGLVDTFDYLHDDYDDSDGSDDAYGIINSHDYSTDDSTDSGASIDSGGMSTKPKFRRRRGRPRGSRLQRGPPMSTSSAILPSGLVRSTCSAELKNSLLNFVTPDSDPRSSPSGEVNSVSSTNNTSSLDPIWSRKAVASGSTKRACVITYSGTEDIDEPISTSRPANCVPHTTSQSVQMLPSTSTVPPIVVLTSASLPQTNISIPLAQQPQQQQFVVVTATQSLAPSVAPQFRTVHLNPSAISASASPMIRIAPGPVATFTQSNGMMPAMYPVRFTTPSMHLTNVHSSIDPKYINVNTTTQSIPGTATLVNVANPTYQFIQSDTMLMTPTMSFSMVPTPVMHNFMGQPPTKFI